MEVSDVMWYKSAAGKREQERVWKTGSDLTVLRQTVTGKKTVVAGRWQEVVAYTCADSLSSGYL